MEKRKRRGRMMVDVDAHGGTPTRPRAEEEPPLKRCQTESGLDVEQAARASASNARDTLFSARISAAGNDVKVAPLPRWYQSKRGKISKAQKQALKDLWPKYGRSEAAKTLKFGVKVDFNEWFCNTVATQDLVAPRRILDIGFGTGDSLIELAKSRPGDHFIGSEIYRSGLASVVMNLEKLGLQNVRVVGGDIRKFLARQCPEGAFDEVCMFFPDPFPNSGQLRVFDTEFVKLLLPKLRDSPGIRLFFASDVGSYCLDVINIMGTVGKKMGWQLKSAHRSSGPFQITEKDLLVAREEDEVGYSNQIIDAIKAESPDISVQFQRVNWRPVTHFESIAQKEGRFVWDFCFCKRPSDAAES